MKKSFTLIETIVVVAVVGLTLPVLFAIIFTLMRQQIRIVQLSQTKRDGDYLINLMENTIKDGAVTIHSASPASDANIICKDVETSNTSATRLYFLDHNNQWFGFEQSGNAVASDSANFASAVNLTTSKTLISNFSIYCVHNQTFSSPSVYVNFDICYINSTGTCFSTRPEEVSSLHYQIRIKLRSY